MGLFAFNCFDGSRGAGRIHGDGSVIGTIQFRGAGPARMVSLPAGTVRVRGEAVCASLQGMPFEPCFHIEKTDDRRPFANEVRARVTPGPKPSLSPRDAYSVLLKIPAARGPSGISQRRSSNANSLCGHISAGTPQICATFQRDNLRRHF
jgi:hypothetical protein